MTIDKSRLRPADLLLVIMALVSVLLTYRSFRPRAPQVPAETIMFEPVSTPTPTPKPVDLDPVRTLTLTALTFFEAVADGRYADAASLFAEEEKRKKWEDNLNRVAKYGNPIAAYKIEKVLERPYCKINLKDENKARCDFPIYLIRRYRDVAEWAAIGMNLEKVGGEWKIVYYRQEALDKDAYDKRKAEEERKRVAGEIARQKLSESKNDGDEEGTPQEDP